MLPIRYRISGSECHVLRSVKTSGDECETLMYIQMFRQKPENRFDGMLQWLGDGSRLTINCYEAR